MMIHRLRFPALKERAKSDTPRTRDARAGFSLIELLTVIAIIAILAAVIFPVATTVRVRAQQSEVISNLKAIHAALGLYRQDEGGKYPPTLGPYVIGSGGGVTTTYGGLFPEFLRDRQAYKSPVNRAMDSATENDMIQPDILTAAQTLRTIADPASLPATARMNDPLYSGQGQFHVWNNMDGSVINPDADPSAWKYIPHYSRYRTGDRNDPDYKRQLGLRNPPESTVVTWNDSFVNRVDGVPTGGDYLVLFLNGSVKKYSVKQIEGKLADKGIVFPDQGEPIWRIEE